MSTTVQPRQVLPRQFYLVTRRCTQRQFLLRPDRPTNNAFTYSLVEAAQRTKIDVLLPCAMSNHYHAVIFDRHGRYPEFLQHFHKMFARSQNRLRQRRENFWSSEQASAVQLVDREAVMKELVYTATNPVKDGLVDKVHHWPGVNGLGALLAGRPLRADRPTHFYRQDGEMPETVELQLTIPDELGPEADVLAELQQRVAASEAAFAAARQRAGTPVFGRRAVLRQSYCARSASLEPQRALRPRVAAGGNSARIEALQRNRNFVADYTAAREAWREGKTVTFPAGTYWLHRHGGVAVAET